MIDLRIHAGNLAKPTTQDQLTARFAQVGEVTSVDLIQNRDSGLSKGFGLVTTTSQESAASAIASTTPTTRQRMNSKRTPRSPAWKTRRQIVDGRQADFAASPDYLLPFQRCRAAHLTPPSVFQPAAPSIHFELHPPFPTPAAHPRCVEATGTMWPPGKRAV